MLRYTKLEIIGVVWMIIAIWVECTNKEQNSQFKKNVSTGP